MLQIHKSHLFLLAISLMSRLHASCAFFTLATSSSSSHSPPFRITRPLQASSDALVQHSLERSKVEALFSDFVEFLKDQQNSIIEEIEGTIERNSGKTFSRDCWGRFGEDEEAAAQQRTQQQQSPSSSSGGITRVLQGGDAIEKGACSFTLIQDGVLTTERAANIRARQFREGDTEALNIQAGDTYSAAALSVVLHSRSPLVPTFRSDVRVFLVRDQDTGESWAWFGGGADLTPYYLFQDDIRFFHRLYQQLCDSSDLDLDDDDEEEFTYQAMKEACDQYFYLPARQEHRGTGGIFFDDMLVVDSTLDFVKNVTTTWMPSWLPIVTKRGNSPYTEQQKQWQKLRRGRYLEFNLLYDVRSTFVDSCIV